MKCFSYYQLFSSIPSARSNNIVSTQLEERVDSPAMGENDAAEELRTTVFRRMSRRPLHHFPHPPNHSRRNLPRTPLRRLIALDTARLRFGRGDEEGLGRETFARSWRVAVEEVRDGDLCWCMRLAGLGRWGGFECCRGGGEIW